MSGRSRQEPAQGPPPQGGLESFPTRQLPRGRRLFRAHTAGLGPWWFGSDGTGRFDLPAPQGTCYLAESELVAVRERLGPVLGGVSAVPAAWLDGVVVTGMPLPATTRVAWLRSADAAAFGVLRELEVMVPYAVPQAWARALAAAGHGGISYGARFTPGRAGAVALFGPAGDAGHPVGESVPAAAVRGTPVAVAPPALGQLTVINPPRTRRRR